VFVGHLAMALGAKKVEPRLPLGGAVAAAFGLDLLWPLLLLVGVETVRVNPNDTAFTHLAFDSYPWSHSLLMVVGWSVLAGLVAKRFLGAGRAAVVVSALVLSHWLLDFVTHRPDLPLWPGGPIVGLRLWASIPATLVFEGALLAVGLRLYVGATSARDGVGRWALYSLVGLCIVLWASQPWAPPPPSAGAVAGGALMLWLLVPWAHWAEAHRAPSA
jgi:membrane-bound metal-dependent hydrolase YbcI (DUF457 family)